MRGKNAARAAPMSAWRAQLVLCGHDVGPHKPAGPTVRLQQPLHQRLRAIAGCGEIQVGGIAARQQAQGVVGLLQLALVALELGAGLFGQAQCLLVVQRRSGSACAAPRCQVQRLLTRLQGLLCQLQPAPGTIVGEEGFDHLPHQADTRSLCALLGGQVVLQGRTVRLRTRPNRSSSKVVTPRPTW